MPYFYLFFILLLWACSPNNKVVTAKKNKNVSSKKKSKLNEIRLRNQSWKTYEPNDFKYHLNPDYKPSSTQKFKLLDTKLKVDVDLKKESLKGEIELALSPYFYPQKKLTLNAQNMTIKSVRVNDTLARYEYDNKALKIILERSYSRYDTLQVRVNYSLKTSPQKSNPVFNHIEDDKGIYFITHHRKKYVWTQGQPESNSRWFPTLDKPNYRSPQHIYITVDSIYRTLSNGRLIQSIKKGNKRQDYWFQAKPHAPYLWMFAVGEYDIIETKVRNIPILYYAEPEDKNLVKNVLKETPRMLEFTEDLLDFAYPWDKYAQIFVRQFVSGGMENTGATALSYQLLDPEFDSVILEKVIFHELAHQWFGNLITPESWANLTLSEGLASYMEYIWVKEKYGIDIANLSQLINWWDYQKFTKTKSDYPLKSDYYQNIDDLFGVPTYSKSPLVFDYLKTVVGEAAFWEAIRYYLKRYAYQELEFDHLRLAFEHITGRDLTWFFAEWFERAGTPNLYYTTNFEDKQLQVTISQKQQLYYLPMTLKIWTRDEVKTESIVLDRPRKTFKFASRTKPKLVLLDPTHTLPARIDFTKTAQEFINQYYLASDIRYSLKALLELQSGINENYGVLKVFLDALNHEVKFIKRFAINTLQDYRSGNKAEVIESIQALLKTADDDLKKDIEKTLAKLRE